MWRTTVRPSTAADAGVLACLCIRVAVARQLRPLRVGARSRDPGAELARSPERPAARVVAEATARGPLARPPTAGDRGGARAAAARLQSGRSGIVGGYGDNATPDTLRPSELWDQIKVVTTRLAENLAFIPLAFALPWLVREMIRPSSRESGSFAILGFTATAIYIVLFLNAAVEDRYSVVLVPLVALAFGSRVVSQAGFPGSPSPPQAYWSPRRLRPLGAFRQNSRSATSSRRARCSSSVSLSASSPSCYRPATPTCSAWRW